MSAKSSHDFGRVLKRQRVDAGLSQEQLAQRARISVQAVGAYERGVRRAPYRETLTLLVGALGLTGAARNELVAAAERGRRRGPPAPARTHNLPLPLSELIGRRQVVEDIESLIEELRLVTLTGTGGIGKTRTAVHVASKIAPRFRDGAWFADLSAVDDQALVAGTVAYALGIAQESERPVAETLRKHLENAQLLLLLDNCEHVLAGAAGIAEAILRHAPGVKILLTSREIPRIPGEHVYRVPPLDLPDAVALFAESAKAIDHRFDVVAENVAVITDICRRLDGIPLAVALAAGRTNLLTLPELARHLDERFAVLTAGSRTAPARQQRMQMVLDWSHELLTDKEQRLFRRLAVFAGSWTLDAASAVCDEPDIIELLGSLVDKSLVMTVPGEEKCRYHLLETTRAYATEKLERSGERTEVAGRHAAFLAKIAAETLAIADAENLRSALRWSLSNHHTVPIAAQILCNAGDFLSQNFRAEMFDQIAEVLRHCEHLGTELHAEMWILKAFVSVGSGALDAADRAIEVLEYGNCRNIALVKAHQLRSHALIQLKRTDEALEVNRLAVKIYEELDVNDPQLSGLMYFEQAYLLNYAWRLAEAREAWIKARDIAAQLGDGGHVAKALCNIAETYYLENDVTSALEVAGECLRRCRHDGHVFLEAHVLNNLAGYRLHARDLDGAARDIEAAVQKARKAGDYGLIVARAVRHVAMLSALQADLESGAKLLGYSIEWFRQRSYYDPGDEQERQRIEALLRNGLTDADVQRLLSMGAALDETEAWHLAAVTLRGAAPLSR